jgi:hypothetical protein
MPQSKFQLHTSSTEREKEEAVIFNYLVESCKMYYTPPNRLAKTKKQREKD